MRYYVRLQNSPLLTNRKVKKERMNYQKSELAKKGRGYRRGETAALQRAVSPLLKLTRFEPKTILNAGLSGEYFLNLQRFIIKTYHIKPDFLPV